MYLYELYKQIEKQSLWRSYLSCFAACANKLYISELCMYIVFILQYQKWQILKRAETSVILIVFWWCLLWSQCLILLQFLTVALHESGTRKTIFWSVTVYNKYLSSQWNLTDQIEPVQDMFTFALHESDTRKTIFWSVTIYSKNVSDHCNFDCSNSAW